VPAVAFGLDQQLEASLLPRLRAREDLAFEALTRALAPALLRVARRITGDEADAHDVLQEGLLSAFKAIDSFTGQSRISTWLYRIVVNCALRSRQRRRRTAVDIGELLPVFDDSGHHVDGPLAWRAQELSSPVEREEEQRLVREAIDRLPDTHRTVLMLRDIEGLDTSEAAEMLEISPGAVKVRLHRARQALRTLLDPHFRSV
jgi:RNA polymerase sigma-70 factor (ECF subfamily)